MGQATRPEGEMQTSRRRAKRTRLPPDPSSTLLQGVYLRVPPKTAPAKLMPGASLNPLYGPLGLSHDVSYRLDATPLRTVLGDNRPATAYSWSVGKEQAGAGLWSRSTLPNRTLNGRKETLLLRQWVQAEMEAFNTKWGIKEATANVVEFLVLASQAGHKLFSHAFQELGRQVAGHCQDRANLMNDIWQAYSVMMNDVIKRVVSQHALANQRVVDLQGSQVADYRTLEVSSAEQEQEINRLKEQVADLQMALQHQKRSSLGTAEGADPKIRGLKKLTSVRFTSFKGPRDSATAAVDAVDSASAAGRPSAVRTSRKVTASVQSSADAVKFGAKRASMMAGALLQSLQVAQDEADEHRSVGGGATALRAQNATLTTALDDSRREMGKMLDQIAELEKAADEMVGLESRAQVAEGERDEAVLRMAVYTPRPSADLGKLGNLDPGVSLRVSASVAAFRNWPPTDLARMLMGEAAGFQLSAMEAAPHAFGCMAGVLNDKRLSREEILQAILDQKGPGWWLDYIPQVTARWLGGHVLNREEDQDPTLLVDFLAGSDEAGHTLSADYYGCLQVYRMTVSMESVMDMLEAVHEPTVGRMSRVEATNRQLEADLEAARADLAAHIEAERLREEGRKRREDEAKMEKKNPVDSFLEYLMAGEMENGDTYWNDGFSGIGAGVDVHKLLRTNGFVRNRHMSKRETEKLVKEVWREKMLDSSGGKEAELPDFLFNFLQKKLGILSAVVETGYNLVFWLWKYSFDADCDLFLKILRGEVREDVYLSQKGLQNDLETVFLSADKTGNKGKESGTLKKADATVLLKAYFAVGEPGGKTLDRFDTLMQAMETDQPGPTIEHRKVFEEDREFNQGAFAEAVREQWLQERIEYFSEIEGAIYHESLGADECDRAQVTMALMKVDVNLDEEQALILVDSAFLPGADRHTVKMVLKRLKAGAGRSQRTTQQALSALGPRKGGKGKPAGKAGDADAKKPVKPAAEAAAAQPPSRPASGKPKAKGKT